MPRPQDLEWWKPKDYSFTKKLDPLGWAWEFLRRNPDYRVDFEKELPGYLEWCEKMSSGPPMQELVGDKAERIGPEHPRFEISGSIDAGIYYNKWGLVGLLNPDTDKPHYLGSAFAMLLSGGGDRFFKNDPAGPRRWRNEWFDLSLPIKPQIEAVRQELLREQRYQRDNKGLKVRRPKSHLQNWTLYLRLLDV